MTPLFAGGKAENIHCDGDIWFHICFISCMEYSEAFHKITVNGGGNRLTVRDSGVNDGPLA